MMQKKIKFGSSKKSIILSIKKNKLIKQTKKINIGNSLLIFKIIESGILDSSIKKIGGVPIYSNNKPVLKKDYVDSLGVSHSGITPTLDKRPKEILSGLVDVLLFVYEKKQENGGNVSTALLRGGVYGNTEIEAGSRYGEGLPVEIPFNYNELIKAIQSADEIMLSNGVQISKENKTVLETIKEEKSVNEKRSFADVYQEVTTVINGLKERMNAGEEDLKDKLTTIIESYLGAGKKITEATPAQQELVEAALVEIKEL